MPEQTLHILVEGFTEGVIIKDFLKPYWEQRFKSCKVFNLKGSGNIRSKYIIETRRILSVTDFAVLILIDTKQDPFKIHEHVSSPSNAYNKLREIISTHLKFLQINNRKC